MTAPTQPLLDDEEEGTIDLAQYRDEKRALEDLDDDEGTIDLHEYAQSKRAKELTWIDSLKEAGLQSAAGLGQAFTWPLDVLKLAMVGEGLTDLDELETAFEKAGKPFDRNKYVKTVMEQGEFIPTQALLERKIDETFGTNIENPKTKTGKFFNKLFFIGGLTRGKGLTKEAAKQGLKAGTKAAVTTEALKRVGVPETVADLVGDYKGIASVEKQARKLSAEGAKAVEIAEKRGPPLMENMLRESPSQSPKISVGRKKALDKKLGMATENAIKEIVEERIPVSKLRANGQDLQVLEDEAYDLATQAASKYPEKLDTKGLISDIDREINRIKSLAPSLGDAKKAAVRVLETEKEALSKSQSNAQQLIQQTREYNSNVKAIYKKPEYSGAEEEVKNAYAFLNDRIRNTIENQTAKEVIDLHKASNAIFGQNAALARSEGLIAKAFENGEYKPKKLNQLLNNKGTGAQLRKDLGPEGVKELKQIAEFGDKAQRTTAQYANSAKHNFKIGDWGPLAGFLLAKFPKSAGVLLAAKPVVDYARGYFLTKPATRKAYASIIKNAANGSFGNMAKDFAVLESNVIDDFGSIEDFMKQGIRELEFYREGEEDED